jgi:hypothetical protein
MHFIYVYEDRTLKPVKIILSRGVGDESDVGDKPNQVHCNMEVSQ